MPIQPIEREVVLNIVRAKGPVIPNDLKQQLKLGDTILLGAMLSELASKGLVKISSVKRGGSPFYYDPANPASLEKAASYLNEKDKRTYDLLKEAKVLRDDEHEALTRVSLRNIKDFAVPFTVKTADGDALYWRYYLVTEKEAEYLAHGGTQVTPETQPTPPPAATEQPSAASPAPASSEPKKPRRAKKEQAPAAATLAGQQQLGQMAPGAAPPVIVPLPSDDFAKKVRTFFDENKIVVVEQKVLKKGEFDFVIEMPTPVGPVSYFCKAKAKKTNNEGDLAAAKLQGAARNLPTLYLTNGELNRRAQEMLGNELKGLVVKKL